MIFSDILGTSDSEATTFTACTGSPYSPMATGKLIQVKVFWSQTAVTSILSAATAKLTCPLWGVPVYCTIQGSGIATAPASPPIPGVQNCDLPVAVGNQITVEVRHEAGIAAITSNLVVEGTFEA